ncbi:MAG: hypothetical protein WCT36_05520, partial [Candidatus Gracilibacteria bacterium]
TIDSDNYHTLNDPTRPYVVLPAYTLKLRPDEIVITIGQRRYTTRLQLKSAVAITIGDFTEGLKLIDETRGRIFSGEIAATLRRMIQMEVM